MDFSVACLAHPLPIVVSVAMEVKLGDTQQDDDAAALNAEI